MTLPRSSRNLAVLLAVVLLAALAGGAYLVLRGASGSEPPSFHFTARLELSTGDDAGDPPVDIMEAWYEPGKGARWSLRYTDPALSWHGSELYSDGETLTIYDGKTNTYLQEAVPEVLKTHPATMPGFSVLLGPLPGASIESFFESRSGGWAIVGEEELLGRSVTVVRVTSGDGAISTFWIDPEYTFVLRHESTASAASGGAGRQVAYVESIEFDLDVRDEDLRFVAPANSKEITATGRPPAQRSGGTLGGPELSVPEGFLMPAYIPAGYVARGEGSTQNSIGQVTAHRLALGANREEGPSLFINQQYRAGGLPFAIPPIASVQVAGRPALHTSDGTEQTLVWAVDDIIVTLRTTKLSFLELMRIATSMN